MKNAVFFGFFFYPRQSTFFLELAYIVLHDYNMSGIGAFGTAGRERPFLEIGEIFLCISGKVC